MARAAVGRGQATRAFFVPGPNGKDLDNIFRLVMLTLLEPLQPPRMEKDPYGLSDNDFQFWDHTTLNTRYAVMITGHPTDSEQPADAFDGSDQDAHTAPGSLPPDP